MDELTGRKIQLIMTLRREGIADVSVLNAIERTPRELFVPQALLAHAYENRALPIDAEQTISQPFVVAFMTEALRLSDRHKVLEIGTGSGYQAAVLSRLCRRVYTIERHAVLRDQVQKRFDHLDLHNVHTRLGDGSRGWVEQAPFDRILLTAAAVEIPDTLLGQLVDGGILVAPAGPVDSVQSVLRITRRGDEFDRESLIDVRFVPLVSGLPAKDESQP